MYHSPVILREAITYKSTLTYEDGETVTVEYEIKPALRATRCAACGRTYQMMKWNHNDRNVGEWFATMDRSPNGNMLTLPVCSFACAQKLTDGGWRDVDHPDVRMFVANDASPARIECTMTHHVKYGEELVRAWEEMPAKHPETLSVPVPPRGRDG